MNIRTQMLRVTHNIYALKTASTPDRWQWNVILVYCYWSLDNSYALAGQEDENTSCTVTIVHQQSHSYMRGFDVRLT